jgi:hypothetical protein
MSLWGLLAVIQNQIVFAKNFTMGFACQYCCPALGLLATSLLLWRRTEHDLGICSAFHSLTGARCTATAHRHRAAPHRTFWRTLQPHPA